MAAGHAAVDVDREAHPHRAADAALATAWAEQGRTSEPVLATAALVGRERSAEGGLVRTATGEPASLPVAVYYRPDALAHVEVVGSQPGDGLWLPESYARTAGIGLGDRITVADAPVTVVGLYRDLFSVDAS